LLLGKWDEMGGHLRKRTSSMRIKRHIVHDCERYSWLIGLESHRETVKSLTSYASIHSCRDRVYSFVDILQHLRLAFNNVSLPLIYYRSQGGA
jgi:hypothetical protein